MYACVYRCGAAARRCCQGAWVRSQAPLSGNMYTASSPPSHAPQPSAVFVCTGVQQQGGAFEVTGSANSTARLCASSDQPSSLFFWAISCLCVCAQVWSSSKEVLSRRLGAQTGASLWQHAHGIDDRPVAPPKARKSVGADVNWGVRFSNAQEADTFLKVNTRGFHP